MYTLACYHLPSLASGILFSLAVFLNPLHLSKAEVAKTAGKWQKKKKKKNTSMS
jgi:hypothetical protein